MSPRSTRTPSASGYDAYNGNSNNAYSSRNSSYIPATSHYSSHNNRPFSIPGSTKLTSIIPRIGVHTATPRSQAPSISDGPLTRRRRLKALHDHTIITLHTRAFPLPKPPRRRPHTMHTIHHTRTYTNYPYTSTVTQSAEYSSGSAPRMGPSRPSQGAPAAHAAILQPSSHPSGHAMPYIDSYVRSSMPVPPAAISPQEGSSSHMTSSRTHARVPSPQLLPKEWYQPSAQPDSSSSYYSQPAAQDFGPSTSPKTHDKQQHKARKPSRSSKLDGIPKDQMQRFRVADFGPGPSSSGTKRTRSPGSDALPPARKGKSKAGLSLDDKEVAAKRKKEADRVQAYRDQLDDVYAELRALLYPDEENSKLAPPNHGKIQCIRDALERIKNSDSNWEQERAMLHAKVARLEAEVRVHQTEQRDLIAENNAMKLEISTSRELVGYLRRCLEGKNNSV